MSFRRQFIAAILSTNLFGFSLRAESPTTAGPDSSLDIFAALRSDPTRAVAYLKANYPHDVRATDCIRLIQSLGQPCNFQFVALDGRKVDSRDYRGKVVLLDFWFKGCGGCMIAMPRIKADAARYEGAGFVVVAVSMDRTSADARDVVQWFALPWPVAFEGKDASNGLDARFCVMAAPWGVLIDRQGRLRHMGLFPGSVEADHLIEALLAEK